MRRSLLLRLCLLITVPLPGSAQALVRNPGFEEGTPSGTPAGWSLQGCPGQWSTAGTGGGHALRLEGNGMNSGEWRSSPIAVPLPASGPALLHLRFQARREPGASGGTALAGVPGVSRDFPLTEEWRAYEFTFALRPGTKDVCLRLGQWQVKGAVLFDEVELHPVQAAHASGLPSGDLGEGERIEDGVYHFEPALGWAGSNFHRPLESFTAGFNSYRWCLGEAAEVIYRHRLEGTRQVSARLKVDLCYHVAGKLRAEASRDGRSWLPCGELDGARRAGTFSLPASLFPAEEIRVRLAGEGKGTNLQIGGYGYEAALEQKMADAEGQSWLFELLHNSPVLEAQVEAGESPAPSFRLALTNRAPSALPVKLRVNGTASPETTLDPGKSVRLHASGRSFPPGVKSCRIEVTGHGGERLFDAQTSLTYSLLEDPRAAGAVHDPGDPLRVRAASSGWKIGRDAPHLRPAEPGESASARVAISAARGEWEAAQVVLTPARDMILISANAGTLRDPSGQPSPVRVRLHEVAYVRVTQPTDSSCRRGWYPDPLPPLPPETPLPLKAGRNQPLWVSFQVPRETRPGDHNGQLTLRTEQGETRIPLAVHVHDFALPEETHLKTALGLGAERIPRYHGLKTAADKQAVFEKYLENFAEHRISPYSFSAYAPIEVRFSGEGADKRVTVDFTRFDAAAEKWLGRFNTFRLPLQGMGGGTYEGRSAGQFGGFKEGTPEYARLFAEYLRQVEAHLRAKGWLDEAYVYWFDEPEPKDYDFVLGGMRKLAAAAPGLKRMLTEQVEPELAGGVDIWCPLTPHWTPEKVRERQAAGDECWWYICCGPRAPYVTEFIDHPGTELRLWAWQSWQYGVTGLLIWETCYWSSSTAFPPPQLQDPWQDPMSYPSGSPGYWGNGDGRFLYPPRRQPSSDAPPSLDGPVDSIRWEALRDGIEDYEYLWLLKERVERRARREGESALVREARALLTVPASVSRDLTHFTADPAPILEHRDRVARMIERLGEP